MARMRCELLNIEGVKNVRDVGGYPLPQGKSLAKRKFIRAASMSTLTPQGMDALREVGVDCVVDLRSAVELAQMPNPFAQEVGVSFYHAPMLDHVQSNTGEGFAMFPRSMSELYKNLLDGDQHRFREIFQIFANENYSTILYHCTAGKDRTGVTTMLLQALCGLDEDSIVEDYAWSQQLMEPIKIDTPGFPMYVLESNPQTMLDTLDHLRQVYGSAAEYLDKAGITGAQRDSIVAKLVE